jgi:peptide deformylase
MNGRILAIATLGHPVLRERGTKIDDPGNPRVQELLDDMCATMLDAYGVGLAAPQVYQSLRVFVMRSRKGVRFPNAPEMPPFVVINPEVLWESEETCSAWEGCLSMPDFRAMTARPEKIHAQWQTLEGKTVELELHDLAARAFRHELDHSHFTMFLEPMDSIGDPFFRSRNAPRL